METKTLELIKKATALTDEDLLDMKLDTAKKYLEVITCFDSEAVETIQQCPLFWNWWLQQWKMRDQEFVQILTHKCGWSNANAWTQAKVQPDALFMYQTDHSVEFLLADNIRPHKILFNEILKYKKEVCNG